MKPSLYSPVKPYKVNQPFGVNWNPVYKQQGLLGHNGEDLQAYHGQPIYASHDGVCEPEIDDHGGNGVVLISNDGTFKTIYWHMIEDDAVVHAGDKVKAGDLIGYADNTGQSTGDHCHWGLCFFPQDNTNGYGGFTDPQPYFNGLYAQDINNPPIPVPKFQFTRTLKLGMWNADCKVLQTLLNAQNCPVGVADGIFGNKTLSGVKAFQTAHNLVSDGIVGIKTYTILNSLL